MSDKDTLKEITVLPDNIVFSVEEGTNLFDALRDNSSNLNSPCSGNGTCGKCYVRIPEGTPLPGERDVKFLSKAQIEYNLRISCGVTVKNNMTVALPLQTQLIRAKEIMSHEPTVKLSSGISKKFLSLPYPSSADQRADTERIQDSLGKKLNFPLLLIRKIPRTLRNNDFQLTLTVNGDVSVVDIEAGNTSGEAYGIAVDIGTTTVVVYLYNLLTGREIIARSITNPQSPYGADVITRINYIHKNGEIGLSELQDKIVAGINSIIEEICFDTSLSYFNIYKACIAGNPTMIQLFLGIDPSYLDKAPYIPVLRDVISFKGRESGLKINPEAIIQILPAVSAYVGADITAGILATGMDRARGIKLLIDIGTNGEIVLGNRDRMISCSAAAGPAFEGANIERGMRAQLGAIHNININEKGVKFDVFGDGVPLGLCGSGLIDLVAQLRELDLLNNDGKFNLENTAEVSSGFSKLNNQNVFSIAGDVYVSQKDIRELQLAKGAIRAGIEILLKEYHISLEDIEQVYLAGSFGNFLRKESVKRTGIIPDIKLSKIKSAGNTAGLGVKLCLLNRYKLKQVQKFTEKVEYLELSYRPDFNDEFIKQLAFP